MELCPLITIIIIIITGGLMERCGRVCKSLLLFLLLQYTL